MSNQEIVKTAINVMQENEDLKKYLEQTLSFRAGTNPGHIGSYYPNLSPAQLLEIIRNADWQPYQHPDIMDGCIAFSAKIPGINGLADLTKLPGDTPVILIDPKKTGKVSAAIDTTHAPETGREESQTIIILGPDEAVGKQYIVYTFHPGAPVRPSPVEASSVDLNYPIITAQEAIAINLSLAKVENGILEITRQEQETRYHNTRQGIHGTATPQEEEASDQTKFYKIVEALTQIDPVFDKLSQIMPLGARFVLMAEACNWAAKEAKGIAKTKKNAAPEEAKKYDKLSSKLMGAAKNHVLPWAIENGAQAQMSEDDTGKPVLLLQHPEAGLIALHQVSLKELPPDTVAKIQQTGDLKFQGVRRQPLARLTALSLCEKEKLEKNGKRGNLANAVFLVSTNEKFAKAVAAEITDPNKISPRRQAMILLRQYRKDNYLA